ncbi:MAG: histidine phosphatase family protein [Suipraeoptans sp.]
MEIYLVRHGETNWNKLRKIQGRSDIPLNDFGKYLAEKTREGLNSIDFNICFTSPLIRAYETAEIILKGKDTDIVKEGRIEEMAFGELEGVSVIASKDHKPPKGFSNFFNNTQRFVPANGGETFDAVRKRTSNFITELCNDKKYEDGNILVTTHGAALASIVNGIKNEPISKFWGDGVSKNCGVTKVRVMDGKPEIIFENKVYYDDELESWDKDVRR